MSFSGAQKQADSNTFLKHSFPTFDFILALIFCLETCHLVWRPPNIQGTHAESRMGFSQDCKKLLMGHSRRFSVPKSFNSSWLTAGATKVTTERVCIKQCVATVALIAHCASLWATCLFQPYYLSPLVSPLSPPFISFFSLTIS